MELVLTAILLLLTIARDPVAVAHCRDSWEIEQLKLPHCGMKLYDWQTHKDREQVCEAKRKIAKQNERRVAEILADRKKHGNQ